MKYYKVPKSLSGYQFKKGWFMVANELFTLKECSKNGIKTDSLENIEINKNDTFYLFGARFQKGQNI